MNTIHSVNPGDFKTYNTAQTQEQFLLNALVSSGETNCVYSHYDRMVIGASVPVKDPLSLGNYDNLKSSFFLQRRELGIINVGGEGKVIVNDQTFTLEKLDCLYIGKEHEHVKLSSVNATYPAIFFMLSAPAHATYPTTYMKWKDATTVDLGAKETCNERTIYKYIHKGGIQSCQLVMGLTVLQPGSVWNTMPPHTHDRRMEVYFYFDLPEHAAVFHFMGQPDETRHILARNYNAVISPPWSIHAGCATTNYGFIWGMAGENMEFTDMDAVDLKNLR